jgi:hypothetical protein
MEYPDEEGEREPDGPLTEDDVILLTLATLDGSLVQIGNGAWRYEDAEVWGFADTAKQMADFIRDIRSGLVSTIGELEWPE